MTPDGIVSLIGSLGFPIVCCGALFYQQNKTMKDFNDKMEKSIKALSSNVEANTIAINTLVTTVATLAKIGGKGWPEMPSDF